MLKWLASLAIVAFIFEAFLGGLINDLLYYTLLSWEFFYTPIRFIFELMGITFFGQSVLLLLYYAPILFIVYRLVQHFFITHSN